jgi:hypothetical protein
MIIPEEGLETEKLFLLGPSEQDPPENGDRIHPLKRYVLNKRQDGG